MAPFPKMHMEQQPDTIEPERTMSENMLVAALKYLDLGFKPLPLPPGSKGKGMTFKWKRLQQETPTEAEIQSWFGLGSPNIALVTGSGLVVVDVDDPTLLDEVLDRCGQTPMRCATPTPGHTHLYYRMRAGVHYGGHVRIRGKALDMRCEGNYAVAPWSLNKEGVPYRWLGEVLPLKELPLLKVSWLRDRKPERRVKPVEEVMADSMIVQRARAYLACVEGAVSGQNGHNRTFRAACVLCQKFGLTPEAAFPILWEWNIKTCEPVWTEREIQHKLEDAWAKRHA